MKNSKQKSPTDPLSLKVGNMKGEAIAQALGEQDNVKFYMWAVKKYGEDTATTVFDLTMKAKKEIEEKEERVKNIGALYNYHLKSCLEKRKSKDQRKKMLKGMKKLSEKMSMNK